jgi:hypothetical protein
MTETNFLDLFPPTARNLLRANGTELVTQVGMNTIKGIVYNVLTGQNLRDSTEWLTRKRVASLNAATLVALVNGQRADKNFAENLPDIAANQLARRLSKADKWLLQWMLGLTDKARQNVLRDDSGGIEALKKRYVDLCKSVITECEANYGNLTGYIQLDDKEKAELNWIFLLQLMTTVGAQASAIRGSEKSLYGKLFEKLILGSLLHIFGFKRIDVPTPGAIVEHKKVFWLSSTDKRESDATALLDSGKGLRFDMGFIGRGNTEISLDKVSRFAHEIELGPKRWYLATIIIVDKIGKKSNIEELAKEINGKIIQMSASYWPLVLAEVLREETGFKAEILSVPANEVAEYLRDKLNQVSFEEILKMSSAAGNLLTELEGDDAPEASSSSPVRRKPRKH